MLLEDVIRLPRGFLDPRRYMAKWVLKNFNEVIS